MVHPKNGGSLFLQVRRRIARTNSNISSGDLRTWLRRCFLFLLRLRLRDRLQLVQFIERHDRGFEKELRLVDLPHRPVRVFGNQRFLVARGFFQKR